MNTTLKAKALYELIGNNSIEFDHNSYEYETDIPYINLNNKRLNIFSAHFVYAGNAIIVEVDDTYVREVCIHLTFNPHIVDEKTFNDNLDKFNIENLLRDMYYETEESWSIGDYETDFLTQYQLKIGLSLSKTEMITDMCLCIRDNATTSWNFPDNTKVNLFLYDEEVETELFTLFLHYNPRNAETYLMLHSCDNKRGEDMYDENLEHFSTEEVREIYKIFRANI